MITRYGDFVLYRPPFKATTALLWVGPIALLLLAVFAFYRTLRSRRARIVEQPLTDAERAEAKRLLDAAQDTRKTP
jgi:cytochrome c-type biogenesis protein CcmH